MKIRNWTTFDNSDFSWSYIAIALGGLGMVIFAVLKPLVTWINGHPLELEVLLPEGTPLALDATEGAVLVGHVASVALLEAPTTTWLARVGLGLLFTAAGLVVLVVLYRFMLSIDVGAAFTSANVRRLRIMAGILLIGPVVAFWAQALWNGHLLSVVFGIDSMWLARFDSVHFAILGFGVLLACVAEVFRRGVQLENDTEGLV